MEIRSAVARAAFSMPFLLSLLFVAGCGTSQPQAKTPAGSPNIVLITIDTLRADRVGATRSPLTLTPNIDSLAAQSTVFDNAVSSIATTIPAHASMFTGLYPRDHGVRWNGHCLHEGQDTLAELLGAVGYKTAAFIAYPAMIKTGGLGQGFQTCSDNASSSFDIRPGSEVNRLAKAWVAKSNEGPFFLWLHYFEVHSPYRLTPYARESLGSYEGPLAHGASVERFYAYGTRRVPATEENRRALNALYDGEVVEADALVGEILETLAAGSSRESTIIIITSYHGQLLGEHGLVGHGFFVWEEALRIPLIVHDPREGVHARVGARVSLIDLFPTILEYAGVPTIKGRPGRSLVRMVPDQPGFPAQYLAEVRIGGEGKGTVAAMEGPRKVVVSSDGTRAYDLAADPCEYHPLPVDRSPDFERLEAVAQGHRARESTAPEREPDSEMLQHLRSLGYIE